MDFKVLCSAFEKIDSTSKRLEKTSILAELLKSTPDRDMESVMLLLRGKLYPEWDRTTLGISEKLAIKAITTATGKTTEEVISRFKKLGDLGKVAAELVQKKTQSTLLNQDLTVDEVIRTLRKLPSIEGHGSVDRKLKTIASLLTSAESTEARFLVRIILEDLRIGIAAGTIRDAIVWRSVMDHEEMSYDAISNRWTGDSELIAEWQKAVQDAIDRSNNSALVAVTARHSGIAGLEKIRLVPGKPLRVMLAQRSLDIADAFKRVGKPAAVEYKYDGFRIQIHKNGGEVKLFTRRLEDVTFQFPDVVKAVKDNLKEDCILDGEAVGYDKNTKRHTAFQHISQRIRRKYEIERLAEELPVEICVFDILRVGDKDVYESPFTERRTILEKTVPNKPLVIKPSDIKITSDDSEIEVYYKDALERGFEGLMFKKLDAKYQPGSRVGTWVKLKPTLDTLDLVVVGAEWGKGKRSGWLTSFTVACQTEESEPVTIGKVGTGLKELEQEGGVTFEEITNLLKPHIYSEEGREVQTKPRIVIEVKFEEIQKSPSYSSGFALRFPRVVRLRPDRRPDEISTTEEVTDLYEAQRGRNQ